MSPSPAVSDLRVTCLGPWLICLCPTSNPLIFFNLLAHEPCFIKASSSSRPILSSNNEQMRVESVDYDSVRLLATFLLGWPDGPHAVICELLHDVQKTIGEHYEYLQPLMIQRHSMTNDTRHKTHQTESESRKGNNNNNARESRNDKSGSIGNRRGAEAQATITVTVRLPLRRS